MEKSIMHDDGIISKIKVFLKTIGIIIHKKEITSETFLPGIEIINGILYYDINKLKHPGDLLHEAGHIAVCEPKHRNKLDENFIANNPQKEGEEIAVLLWSYLAAKSTGISPIIVFHKNGYKGESDAILKNFDTNNFIGLPLLEWFGIAKNENNTIKIISWLR